MQKISSFQKDHERMRPGFSLSGVQRGVSTFDLRFKVPNAGDYLSNAVLHTVEHLLATAFRNSAAKEDILYFGPMGCRTGFYLLTAGLSEAEARALTAECIRTALALDEIPGAKRAECGNYLEHDLEGARRELRQYLSILTIDQIP